MSGSISIGLGLLKDNDTASMVSFKSRYGLGKPNGFIVGIDNYFQLDAHVYSHAHGMLLTQREEAVSLT
jgi:hypothetical protein